VEKIKPIHSAQEGETDDETINIINTRNQSKKKIIYSGKHNIQMCQP